MTHFRTAKKIKLPIQATKTTHFQGLGLPGLIASVLPTSTGPAQKQGIDFSFVEV
jgi:hypothetical protein